jgi:hypothetical protein
VSVSVGASVSVSTCKEALVVSGDLCGLLFKLFGLPSLGFSSPVSCIPYSRFEIPAILPIAVSLDPSLILGGVGVVGTVADASAQALLLALTLALSDRIPTHLSLPFFNIQH